MLEHVYGWIQTKGKLWAFRLIVLIGVIGIPLDTLGVVSISVKNLLLFVLASLYLFGEVFVAEIGEVRRLRDEGVLLGWPSVQQMLRAEIPTASQVMVIARTGETFYYATKDVLVTKGRFKLRLVLTRRAEDSEGFVLHQNNWIKRWQALFRELPGTVAISTTVCQCELQGIVVDDRVCYLSYRGVVDGRKLDSSKHIRSSALTEYGRFLIGLAKAWVELRAKDAVSATEGPSDTAAPSAVQG